jgi:hypothetical protein
MVGLISEEERPTNWGGSYSIFTATPKSARSVPAARMELIGQAGTADPIALELDQAKSFYLKLQAMPIPSSLPSILQRGFGA